jgi:hypothetical protein
MWWTNWVTPREYTPEEIRDTSDVKESALKLFKDRIMMFPCFELIDATSIWMKQSIFDLLSLPSWHKSRVCLIGDAAHAVSSIIALLIIGFPKFWSRCFVGNGRYFVTCSSSDSKRGPATRGVCSIRKVKA